MHGSYPISNDDMRYVLSTFVVIPMRWMDRFGWRAMTEHERVASANYYRELGRHMGLRDVPETYEEFERLLDDYERANFAFDEGGRAVSDATLDLTASWYPRPVGAQMRRSSICLLDDPLREAFGYPRPPAALTALVRGGMRLRGRLVRLLPPRRKPHLARDGRQVRGYPDGYRIAELGTFEGPEDRGTGGGGCPFGAGAS